MFKNRSLLLIFCSLLCGFTIHGQQISKEELIFLTPKWEGERFPDGRPKVPVDILERMKLVTLEEAWATCRGEGYNYQYEGDWMQIQPEGVLVGRAVTATFFPGRPDIHLAIQTKGQEEDGRILAPNSWAIDMLQPGDVYVVNQSWALQDGPTIGDNLGNSIKARSGNGFIYDGPIRDVNGLKEIENFTTYFKTYHPSHHFGSLSPDGKGQVNTTLVGINTPTRIGNATVMPGDVILARDGGVIFIPPHLAQKVVETSEIVRLRDMFGHQRLREKKYTAGQIDSRWTEEIENDFAQWLKDNKTSLPVSPERVEELLKNRTW